MDQITDIYVEGRHVAGSVFRERARQAAAGLLASGIRAGDSIAVLMRNDTPMLEIFAAAQLIGAYAVPLNWHSKADENGYVLSDCGAKLLVVHLDLLAEIAKSIPASMTVVCVKTSEEIARNYRVDSDSQINFPNALEWESWISSFQPADIKAQAIRDTVFYTSGTTGRPKGVLRQPPTEHHIQSAIRMRELMYGDMNAQSRALICAPMYHGGPNSFALRAMRCAGVLVMPPRFNAEGMLADIEKYRITHMYAVSTMFVRLLALPPGTRNRYDISSLKSVIHGGSPCSPSVKRAMIEWWGPIISEYYGSTELGPLTLATSQEWLSHEGTAGRALPGVELEIHGEQGESLEPGKIGEICAVNHGMPEFTYLNRQADRDELQRGNLIATGDMGFLDENGFLFVCDRKKDMVISGGVNIYPAEIENVLMQMPGIEDCAIFGIPDEEYGESLAAYVQPAKQFEISEEQVREFLVGLVAGFKVPRIIEVRPDLPREDSGKIKKRLLRQPYWERAGRTI